MNATEKKRSEATIKLMEALDDLLSHAGKTVIKPAGQKSYGARVVADHVFENLEAAYSNYNIAMMESR